MWKKRKFSLQSGLELMSIRMIDEVLFLTNCTAEAGFGLSGSRSIESDFVKFED